MFSKLFLLEPTFQQEFLFAKLFLLVHDISWTSDPKAAGGFVICEL